jgi:hypothetical protein
MRCAATWSRPTALDKILGKWLFKLPGCRVMYAMDVRGTQLSSNVYPEATDPEMMGQNLATRPYLLQGGNGEPFWLSDVYISQVSQRSCLTAVHTVNSAGDILGYIAADFDLRDMPMMQVTARQDDRWKQISGDPAIRTSLFQQKRIPSAMDEKLLDVISIVEELVCERGIFHIKLHFSSSRATLWLMDDPYHYRVHVMHEILNPSICLAYSKRSYPSNAKITAAEIRPMLVRFIKLRLADEHLYLRSASINIMNGLVGLTFSSDGSHYMGAHEFMRKDTRFWYSERKETLPLTSQQADHIG